MSRVPVSAAPKTRSRAAICTKDIVVAPVSTRVVFDGDGTLKFTSCAAGFVKIVPAVAVDLGGVNVDGAALVDVDGTVVVVVVDVSVVTVSVGVTGGVGITEGALIVTVPATYVMS
jgi:hypothetical protein